MDGSFRTRTAHPNPARLRLAAAALLAALCAAMPVAARADWLGAYQSKALKTTVNVKVRLPAGGADGELRFVEKSCSLALKAGPDATSYLVQRTDKQSDPGPYCATWLDGKLTTTPAAGGALQTRVTSQRGNSYIDVLLREQR